MRLLAAWELPPSQIGKLLGLELFGTSSPMKSLDESRHSAYITGSTTKSRTTNKPFAS
jgi:hypothetical protein